MTTTPVNLDITDLLATSVRLVWVQGTAAFSIASLFSASQAGAWYDPSDITTLYQDAAGTTPATADGDPVGRMLDKSGNGNHATQTVSGSRPVYRTDGTLHWLEFDGVDDLLFNYGFSRSNPDSLFFALEWLSPLSSKPLDGIQNNDASIFVFPDGRIRAFSSASFVLTPAGTISLDTPTVGTAIFNLANSKIRINGALTAGTTGVMSTSGITMGGNSENLENFTGKLFSVISLGRLASPSEIENTEVYLANLSGATL